MNETPRKPLTPDRSEPIERSVADVGGIDGGPVIADDYEPVSYTHLTLPTMYTV